MEDLIGPLVRRTYGPRVLPSHGAFAGLFRLDSDDGLLGRQYRKPVLVACTDGVGSKLLIAIQARRYDTIGIDLVAMSVNDLICCGPSRSFSSITARSTGLSPSWSRKSSAASPRASGRFASSGL